MTDQTRTRTAGSAAPTALFVVFVTLKLLEIEPVAGWSWWWVLAPFWGSIILAAAGLAGMWAFFSSRRWLRERARRRFEDLSR